jgi:hypothetical protein
MRSYPTAVVPANNAKRKTVDIVPLRPRINEACHSLRDPNLSIVAYPLFRIRPLCLTTVSRRVLHSSRVEERMRDLREIAQKTLSDDSVTPL